MIRVIMIEDEWFWQEAIKETLNRFGRFEIVAQVETLEQAKLIVADVEADVIVLDVSIGANAQGGIDLAYEWKVNRVEIPPIFMLTSHEESAWIAECFAAGAANYLCKRDLSKLPEEISRLIRGQHGMVSYVAEALRTDYLRLREQADRDQLTRQERLILEYIHAGYPQPRIANKLCISERTIKNHISNILRKFQVSTSKEAARRAAQRGWIEVMSPEHST